jgi:ABC-type glycerol-3-phosphate transport system substrate-binding protein
MKTRINLWTLMSLLLVVSMLLAGCGAATTVAPTEPPKEEEKAVEPAKEVVVEPTDTPVPPEPTATEAEAEAPKEEAACPNGVVTVGVHDWSSADRQEYWDQVINAFNDANPCIKAETVKLPEDRAVRLQEISAGTAPCLVGFDSSDLPRVYLMGALMDLTPLMDADNFDPLDEFYESVYNTGIVDGKPVAIAKDYSVSAFYVNVDLLEKAGLEVPTEGWTYDDYLEMAKLLTIDENGNNATSPDFDPTKVAQWGGSLPYWGGTTGWWRGFQSALYSFGTHTISDDGKTTTGYINNEVSVQTWEWFRDFIHKEHAAPGASYMAAIEQGFSDLFANNKLAIAGSYWGPWFQDTFNKAENLKWAVVPLPTGPGGHEAAIMWMGWGINSNCSTPDEAWQLLKWLTTDPGQRVFALKAMTGDKSVAAELQQEKDPYWSVYLAEVPFQGRLDDMTTPFYTTCVDIPASELMGKIFADEGVDLDIQAELDKLAESADKCLAESTIE